MFRGSIVAIVTPMLDTGEVDYDSLHNLIDWHLSSGTDGFVFLGTTGESATITADERKTIITRAIDHVRGRIPVIVGTGTCSTSETIEMTHQAKKLGADAALLVTPHYTRPTQQGLFLHFKHIAESVALPQILYNVPARTACDMHPETVIRLAEISNIVAIKEATGDVGRVQQIIESGCELDLLSGDDKTALDFMLAGGKGVISVVANVAPGDFKEMCSAALVGDSARAHQLNRLLNPLYGTLFLETNPIPTKWVLSSMQMIPAGIRLPLTPLASRYHGEVRQVMQQIGL